MASCILAHRENNFKSIICPVVFHMVVLVMKAVVPVALPVPFVRPVLNALCSLKHIYNVSVNVCYVVQTL